MAYYLAVDAGGAKTDFALADETRRLIKQAPGQPTSIAISVES